MARTLRERRIRKRTARTLKRVRSAPGFGKKPTSNPAAAYDAGIGHVLEAGRRKAGFRGKPFLELSPEAAMRAADKAFLPGKKDVFRAALLRMTRRVGKRSKRKEQLVRKLFGKGKLGMLMIKPELFANRKLVMNFLESMGIRVVFTTPFVFSKGTVERLYPHAMKAKRAHKKNQYGTDPKKPYEEFAIPAFSLQNAPSMVIVFEHRQAESYQAMGNQIGENVVSIPNEPQNAFNAVFKASMRRAISRMAFEKKGFRQSGVTGAARELDQLGFFERALPRGFDMLSIANGLHFPDSKEILMDARTLIMQSDLERIAKKYE